MILPKGSLITLVANPDLVNAGPSLVLSEHNRAPMSVEVERLENKKRMGNGRMRKTIVADKLSWSTSWKLLPHADAGTVDKKAGADTLSKFYDNYPGELRLVIHFDKGVPEKTYRVFISDFSKTLTNRGLYQFYDVSLKLEEV